MSPISDLRRRPHKPGLGVGASVWAARLAVVVSGAASAFLFARTAVPYSAGFLSAVAPRLWAAARVWLVPPYLFVTVNLIILAIWMLSGHKFHPEEEKPPSQPQPEPDSPVSSKPAALVRNPSPLSPAVSGGNTAEPTAATPKLGGSVPDPWSESSCLTAEEPDEASTASSGLELRRSSDLMNSREEEEDENDDSMEARWKAIMAGGAAPVVRRSDTMERLSSPVVDSPPLPAAAAAAAAADPGHDVLNRRFEEFIKKNYEQIN